MDTISNISAKKGGSRRRRRGTMKKGGSFWKMFGFGSNKDEHNSNTTGTPGQQIPGQSQDTKSEITGGKRRRRRSTKKRSR